MKKIDKQQIAQRDGLQSKAAALFSDLEIAVEQFNKAMEDAWEKVEEAKEAYNDLISDANSWQEGVAADIQSYMDERSEKWLESDKAAEYEAWRQEFEDAFDAVELEKPDPLELDAEDLAECLGNRNESIGESA